MVQFFPSQNFLLISSSRSSFTGLHLQGFLETPPTISAAGMWCSHPLPIYQLSLNVFVLLLDLETYMITLLIFFLVPYLVCTAPAIMNDRLVIKLSGKMIIKIINIYRLFHLELPLFLPSCMSSQVDSVLLN